VRRLAVVLALAGFVVACNPKSLKPGYCNTQKDCTTSETCDPMTRKCVPKTDGSADRAEVSDGGPDGADASDASDTRDASDAGDTPPVTCRTNEALCTDGGYDGGPGVCEREAGICVECLHDTDCATRNATTPICDQDNRCRACKTDAECPVPNVCMTDGHCATSDEVVFVEAGSPACSPPDGSTTNTYCTLSDGVLHVGGTTGRSTLVVRGPFNGPLVIDSVVGMVLVVGKPSAAGAAQIGAGVNTTGITVSNSGAIIRDLMVFNGGGPSSKGIVASGATTTLKLVNVQVNLGTGLGIQADTGAQLTMDRCVVNGNTVGGLLINGASYAIQNSAFVNNGYGVKFNATAIPRASTFSFSTITGNTGNALTCDSTNPQTVNDSIVLGVVDSCSTINSVLTMPTQLSGYRLNGHVSCPASSGSPPDHDIDDQPRSAPIDCGADQFVVP
jgi:hypothetical protein